MKQTGIRQLKILLMDERGDLYFQKMILIALSFVIGAIILTAFMAVFDAGFIDRLSEIVESILTW
ncbi:MAG: hypothetical protein GX193_04530 [Clostridiales bacterium]|nr:hypothetical protein [Clostridiales bacterium]